MPSVDHQHLAGDVRRFVGREERYRIRDVLGGAERASGICLSIASWTSFGTMLVRSVGTKPGRRRSR